MISWATTMAWQTSTWDNTQGCWPPVHVDKQGSRLVVLQAAWQTSTWDNNQGCWQPVHMDKQGSRLVVL